MPLSKLPIIMEGDYLSLSVGFRLQAGSLADELSQQQHALSPTGRRLTQYLLTPRSAKDLQSTVEIMGIPLEIYRQYLEQLHGLSALTIHGQQWLRRSLSWLQYALLGSRPSLRSHRQVALFRTIAIGVVRSSSWLILPWLFVLILCYGANLATGSQFWEYSLLMYGLIMTSTFTHELAHWLCLRSVSVCFVQWRGYQLGIMHQSVSPRRILASSLAGPAAGMVAALLGGYILSYGLALSIWPVTWTVVGLHALSWLPSFSDGWSLARLKFKQKEAI